LGVAISVTLIEPFFTRPQDAVINSIGGVAAFATATRAGVVQLWWVYLAVSLVVFGFAAFAVLSNDRPAWLKRAANLISRRLGRPVVIGGAALFIEIVREAAAQEKGYQYLAIGTTALIIALVPNWSDVSSALRTRPLTHAVATGVVGPRLLTLSAVVGTLQPGALVRLRSPMGETTGYVANRLSRSDGLRYEIVLEDEWTAVCAAFPCEVQLATDKAGDAAARPVGFALAKSTDLSVEFRPFVPPSVGDPLILGSEDDATLYQVNDVSLVSETVAGASVLTSRAAARQVGVLDHGFIRSRPTLPKPHQILGQATQLSSTLPADFAPVGVVKGTTIPVGIGITPEMRGHIAVLGMSGMGKTAAAQRICKALSGNSVVMVLDTTGEYRTRLGFPAWTADDFETVGFSVYEPTGEPTQRAEEFIKKCMTKGASEYAAGARPTPRVVVLEEAHSFIPEWNFASRNQQDMVSLTTRYIMQSRKFAVSFVIVSQRTAVVSKSGLSQCENYVVLRTIDQTSLDYLEAVVGAEQRHAITRCRACPATCVAGGAGPTRTPQLTWGCKGP